MLLFMQTYKHVTQKLATACPMGAILRRQFVHTHIRGIRGTALAAIDNYRGAMRLPACFDPAQPSDCLGFMTRVL